MNVAKKDKGSDRDTKCWAVAWWCGRTSTKKYHRFERNEDSLAPASLREGVHCELKPATAV